MEKRTQQQQHRYLSRQKSNICWLSTKELFLWIDLINNNIVIIILLSLKIIYDLYSSLLVDNNHLNQYCISSFSYQLSLRRANH
ncbi:unnamed protein product [Schistosoma curassoni]|uniref:Uncharacterized protein n=1 Tax=Schistosoma curassoni TaxID=6186 RepID=A0A183KMS4_9TREM|nr:unnamed protein product [Schistosoma curassoni]